MRPTIRPVTLKRIIELVNFSLENASKSVSDFQNKFDLSENRAKSIVAESRRLDLIKEDSLEVTEQGEVFNTAASNSEWKKLNRILEMNSPHYSSYLEILEKTDEALTKEEILERLQAGSEELKYNKTGFSVLSDWGERLGITQRNVFTEKYYKVKEEQEISSPAEKIEKNYEYLQSEAGLNLKQRYVSIPELRETFCEEYRLPRDIFDQFLTALHKANIGKMELSGAPLDTQAKKSDISIKRMEKAEDGGITTTKMSSDQILRGLQLENGKVYYYLAIFDSLNEVQK
jgi:hypothetical protein